ncbi:MAG: sec-independent protein translocase protein TatA [Actinomycetota bacterium]|jgi:TatA/E family protein of Tat protein translocase|nr:sec-independent protein translocase protein TatA [Actinomycetota bacterium]
MEILVILVVALVVLGPSKLPEAARSIGKAMAEIRRLTSGFESEVREAFAEPATTAEPTGTPAVIEPSVLPPAARPANGALPTHPADAELPRPSGDPNLS